MFFQTMRKLQALIMKLIKYKILFVMYGAKVLRKDGYI